jgi:hypothetical protein
MADLRATPYANPLTGLSNDAIQGLLAFMQDKRRTQQLQGLGNLLESTGIPKTIERAAYAESPRGLLDALTNVNRANVPFLKPETADALLTVAPLPRGAGKVAMAAGRAGEKVAERVVPQILERGGLPAEMVQAMGTNTRSLLDVYHGTPHTLPPTAKNKLGEFDASKIGTGEGAQAYGHGIYVAENPAVAKDYTFLEQNWFDTSEATYKGKPIDYWYEKAQKDKELAYRTKNKTLEKEATAREAYWENIMTHSHPEKVLKTMTDPDYGWDEAAKYAKSIDITKFKGVPDAGNLYKVDLPDEKIATMLDWDLPLSKQSPQVQAAVEKLTGLKVDKSKMAEFDDALLGALQGGSMELPKQPLDPIGADLYAKFIGGGNEVAARKLQELGVSGVKYFDQFSRQEGKGTRNFVLFPSEEKSLTILERNGLLADQFEALPVEKKKEILSLLE